MNKPVIQIDPAERVFWMATEKGWFAMGGYLVKINGLPCTAIMTKNEDFSFDLKYSELQSGMKIAELAFSPAIYFSADTKEKYLDVIHDGAKTVARVIDANGYAEGVLDKAEKELAEYVKKHGEKPEEIRKEILG